MKITLKTPVTFGTQEIAELELKTTARAFKEFSLPVQTDGSFLFQPYKLAAVGVRMAGKPDPVLDLLSVEDMNTIAQAVMSFFAPSLATGSGG